MIPGWNSDITPWAEENAHRIPPGGTYLEVGVFLGASLSVMGQLRPDISLIAVDPWISEPWMSDHPDFDATVAPHGGDLFLAFLHQMMTHAPDVLRRTRVIRGTTCNVEILSSVDMLFIDGAHDLVSVRTDLCVYAPRVRDGGIVAGHDYNVDPGAAVNLAVDGYLGHKPNVRESVWWWEK
jgi:predicted O-methyltransferase YrrM